MPGLTAAFSLFDHYLDGRADHPVGVAVSGGGDSVALLYWLAEWGRRPLHVFCVDHGLNPSSSQWTQGVARHAENVGAAFTALSWTGEKPTTGLSAAARSARHALLADAARAAGVGVLCLGHTADDIAEARLMRAAGSSVGRPTLWSPSPAWPQGRGVFLFRPLLSQRREALRTWLKSKGLSWIDDPANDNTASLRARIRQAAPGQDVIATADPGETLPDVIYPPLAPLGVLVLDTERLSVLRRDTALRILATAAVCAGGRDRLPRRDSAERALDAVRSGTTVTLCGARIEDGRVTRDFGDIGRNGQPELRLEAGNAAVWDGRFVFKAMTDCIVRPSGAVRSALSDADRATLMKFPAALRTVVPTVDSSEGPVLALPEGHGHCETVRIACLVLPRFKAATGAVTRESDLATDV